MTDNEPTMTAGEEFDTKFGSNDPRRRGESKPKPVVPDLTAGQVADDIDSTKKKSVIEEQQQNS